MTIRSMNPADIPAVQDVLSTLALFPPEMLPDIAAPVLSGDPDHVFLVAETGAGLAGFAYLRAEEMALGVWNMLALGVAPARQGAGLGAALVARAEVELRARGARMLLVDTSDAEDFAGARRFYARRGYAEVARIPDYWAEGDAKVTFARKIDAD